MVQEHLNALKRNKIQKWLLIASLVFLLIASIALFVHSQVQSTTENTKYTDIPTAELLQIANENYASGDFKKAIPYLSEGARRGNARAHYSLGYMYEHGEGVSKNLELAKEHYHLAAQQGHSKAQTALKALGK